MIDQQSFKLALASSHHIQSFNYMVQQGLNKMLTYFTPMELNPTDLAQDHNKNIHTPFNNLKITFTGLKLGQPYRFNDPTAIHQ